MVFLFASCTLTALALACAQGGTEMDSGVRRTSREQAIRVDPKGEAQPLTQGYNDAVRRHITSPQTKGSDDDDALRRQARNVRGRGGDADESVVRKAIVNPTGGIKQERLDVMGVGVEHAPVGSLAEKQLDEHTARTALIMHGTFSHRATAERGGRLEYMYEPPVTTLRRGFEQNGNWTVIVPTTSRNYVETVRAHMGQLKPGDIFIWLGCVGPRNWRRDAGDIAGSSESLVDVGEDSMSQFMNDRASLEFESLRNRGIKLVYYQSEPVHACAVTLKEMDEIWDFSWHNIDMCNKNPNAPPQRYVPLAAMSTAMAKQNEDPGALLFFGADYYRPCWNSLKKAMGHQLASEYRAWNDEEYQAVIRKHNIFLNIHKGCGGSADQHNPITWRNAKLLNAGGIIISQHSYPKDEQEFAGLLDFVELEDIPRKYKELASMNETARQKLVDLRMAQFRERFHPRRIFQAAGIV